MESIHYCECGCGEPTRIAAYDHSKHGYVKGQAMRFIHGHHLQKRSKDHTASAVERFWSKVDKTSSPNGCWLWTGAKSHGYGTMVVDKRNVFTHRYSYELANSPIPKGMEVCHNCPNGDNKACVNPAHLWLGTHSENVLDMIRKGHSIAGDRAIAVLYPECVVRGETHGNAKLTDDKVREIRQLYAQGDTTLAALALRYGVSFATISLVVNRKVWQHVA